ncbi:hypothetical protein [Bacillus clarus]|uniref:Uncharacterized protein n=1 Tax=Bacillus clarus TaxID=2338372 RepID=A0A090YIP3_9BACI|nr:hypothetical protein [Bacillus clarus]KFM98673.1 hypothetical protein DJ93_4893 [Bacillus clarus]
MKRHSKDGNVTIKEKVEMFECPDCGFGFDAFHEIDDEHGGYECPVCELDENKRAASKS